MQWDIMFMTLAEALGLSVDSTFIVLKTPKGVKVLLGVNGQKRQAKGPYEEEVVQRLFRQLFGHHFQIWLAREAGKLPHPRPFWNWSRRRDGGWLCIMRHGQDSACCEIGRGVAPTKAEALLQAAQAASRFHPSLSPNF